MAFVREDMDDMDLVLDKHFRHAHGENAKIHALLFLSSRYGRETCGQFFGPHRSIRLHCRGKK